MIAPRRRQGGFTLLELLISLAIIGFMMLIAWGTIIQTVRAKKQYEAIQDRYREVRTAMRRIEKDLGMAYLSGNEDQGAPERRTFFVGESSASGDSLRFSSLAHQRLWAEASESDQTIISYYLADDPEDRSRKNLYRRETRRMAQDTKWDQLPADADILLTDVTKFELEYYEPKDKEWEEAWSTISADGKPGRVPERVKIVIGFKDERGKDVQFMTQARIHLQEMLNFFT